MRMWTKSACVALAVSIPLILLVVGMKRFDHQAQANTRIASKAELTLTAAVTLAATTVKAKGPAKYVVKPGDTLSGIATRFSLPGGWAALYAANQSLVGPDPNVIHAGTVLVLPGNMAPARYTVAPGDTLSGIANELAVPGGWVALYAANRQVVGPNPDLIHAGMVLIIPGQVAPAPTHGGPPGPPPPSATGPRPPVPYRPQSHAPTGTRRAHVPVTTRQPAAATAMPRWLLTMLLGVAVLIGAAFLAEPVVVVARRRRGGTARRRVIAERSVQERGSARSVPGRPRIVVADYHRLVVTHCKGDDTVYVLRPHGANPLAVLHVARLVLSEHPYQELANHLGVSASAQTEGSEGSKPSQRPPLPDGSGSLGLGPPRSFGCYLSGGCDADLLRSDSTRAAT